MGSKNLLNPFDHWLPAAPPARSRAQSQAEPRHELPVTTIGCTGRRRRPPFYLRWWLDAHRD